MKTIGVFFFVLVFFPVEFVYSAPSSVKCPPYIANLRTGTYAKARGNYVCFSRRSGASSKGFIAEAPTSSTISLSGNTRKVTESFYISKVPARFTYTHNGESNFAVWIRRASDGAFRDLLANDIGPISAETAFYEKGAFYLDITADGDWIINISQ